jgi:predicted nuclease with TOPRIM domain
VGQRLELKAKNEKLSALQFENSNLKQMNEMIREQNHSLSQKLITFEEQYKLLNEKFVSLINGYDFKSNSN